MAKSVHAPPPMRCAAALRDEFGPASVPDEEGDGNGKFDHLGHQHGRCRAVLWPIGTPIAHSHVRAGICCISAHSRCNPITEQSKWRHMNASNNGVSSSGAVPLEQRHEHARPREVHFHKKISRLTVIDIPIMRCKLKFYLSRAPRAGVVACWPNPRGAHTPGGSKRSRPKTGPSASPSTETKKIRNAPSIVCRSAKGFAFH